MDVLKFEPSEVTPSKCPHCGAEQEMASGEGQPSEGDVSICIKCAGVSVFGDELARRLPTQKEAESICADERVDLIRAAIMLANSRVREQ